MAEEVPHAENEEMACNSVQIPKIISAAQLYELLFRELIASRRSLLRALAETDKALDLVKEQKLKP